MRCSICKTSINRNNIGYVRKPFENEGRNIIECKKCHNGRARRTKKIRGSWLLNS